MKRAIIIGAGPAGLTAALELLRKSDIKPIILEATGDIGGISRTVKYKGNRMDIGGHRFFSKSDRVMQWWMDLMPPEFDGNAPNAEISYHGNTRLVAVPARLQQEPVLRGAGPIDPNAAKDSGATKTQDKIAEILVQAPRDPDLVMLIRQRKSRIFYLRKFFDYPIAITTTTLKHLGISRTLRIGISYLKSRLIQIKPEKSLQDFLINRFGRELYQTFFKSYTEKVWGTPCSDISPEWGAQRIRGLSLTTAVRHFLTGLFSGQRKKVNDLAQKGTDTSLIERFLYPKFGPGQLWEHVADQIREKGGEIHLDHKVDRIHCSVTPETKRINSIETVDAAGKRQAFAGDYFLSTMPMRELVDAIDAPVPANVREVSDGLQYRDFITIGLLVDRLKVQETGGAPLKDTWIYVQEPDVLLGRLQIFNNWSPALVADPSKVWLGLEYFCYETDDLWKMPDKELLQFAIAEVARIGILNPEDVQDGHVVRVPKTYPAYFGTYNRFAELREFTDAFENLYLVGRNGMHKYNNQDHSMLTAMTVVNGIVAGHVDKAALWAINTEQEHHENEADGPAANSPG
jgi:protoporphyrinogen oxidase